MSMSFFSYKHSQEKEQSPDSKEVFSFLVLMSKSVLFFMFYKWQLFEKSCKYLNVFPKVKNKIKCVFS